MDESILAVSLSEAARRIGVCKRTVVNLINAKELKSRKIGRRRVVCISQLVDFLRRDHPTGPSPSNGQLNAFEVAGSSPPSDEKVASELGYSRE